MDLAAQQRANEMGSVQLHLDEGSPEQVRQVLKSLDERGAAQELVRQQYSGRYPFELVQNADDAARENGTRGRARFVLTETALLVADNGSGFGEKQVEAICSLGRSSKGPGTSIGHKGLGFKSVGEISDRPQIVSVQTQFQFDAARIRAELDEAFGGLPSRQRIPVYAFPYPIEPADLAGDGDEISALRDDGFSTVIRLPLLDGVDPNLVAKHLVENLNPRLLLFLPCVDHLELRGTNLDFSAEVARDTTDDLERVYMETETGIEEWLVYRGSTVPTTEALVPLGDDWSQLADVKFAVAVPLEAGEATPQPRIDETFPLHVYFPTEERPRLHVAVHAEWVLTMDRRGISHTPEAIAFNNELTEAVTDFVATTIATDLVQRCNLSVESVRALIPEHAGHIDGSAGAMVDRWRSVLASVAFLPLAGGGQLGRPVDIELLPETIPDHEWAQRLSALPADQTLRADVEADWDVRQFVSAVNDESEMTDAEFLSMLATPTSESAVDFYSFLLAWREENWRLVDDLKSIPCVQTTSGQFLAPAQHTIFFPRADESVPDDIPVPIAALAPVEGLKGLLRDLDVKSFEWRDLIRDYLIKILEREDADAEDRERAMNGLRAYQAARSDAAEVGLAILGRVLVPARNRDGTLVGLRPAGRVYFGEEWTGAQELEEIYGPFNEIEFLAADVANTTNASHDDEDFYRMLGVADHPRLTEVISSSILDSASHPHRRANVTLYNEWLNAVGARRCLMGHDSQYQRLTISFHLDRLEDIVATKDPRRHLLLWNQLARHWGKIYEGGMASQMRCEHRFHSTNPERSVDSLLAYTLRSRAWVPVALGGKPEVVRPHEAWFETSEPPPRIQTRIPHISQSMYHMRGGPALVAELGLIDTSHPEIDDLLELLESVAAEADTAGSTNNEIELAARWVQRTIDDVLSPDEEPHPTPSAVRVLAMHSGTSLFASRPPFAEDSLLRDTWQHEMPILLADTDSGRLTRYLGLAKLDDETETTAVPLNVHHGEARHRIMRRLDDAKPYVVALIRSENSRMANRSIRALSRLQVIVCDQLLLRYRYDGRDVEREDASCYIAVNEVENEGGRPQPIGTAYIELDCNTGEADWFAVGRQLAQHLSVAAHTDAITMLLKVDAQDRDRMVASRHILSSLVNEARARLNLPLEDEDYSGNILDTYLSLPQDMPTAGVGVDPDRTHTAADSEVQRPDEPEVVSAPDTMPPLIVTRAEPPAIDFASVTITDAEPAAIANAERTAHDRPPSFTIGATSSAPTVQSEAERRRVGKRGEEVAFVKERERVEAMRANPDLVVWQSKNDELAPFDILSVDHSGDEIYIEVKSTVGSEPSDAFYISNAELLEASFHRSRYYIYRVTDVDTATPRITRWCNPIELIRNAQGRLLLSTAQMELGIEASKPEG